MSSAHSAEPFPAGTGFASVQTQLISCSVKPERVTVTPGQTPQAGEHPSCSNHRASKGIGAGDSGTLIVG